MYLVHWGFNALDDNNQFKRIPMYKIWAAMEECVEKGYTRHIGVSNFNTQILLDMLSYCNIKPANNQIELHPFMQQPELVKFCQDNEISLTAYSPLSAPGRSAGGVQGGSGLFKSNLIKYSP